MATTTRDQPNRIIQPRYSSPQEITPIKSPISREKPVDREVPAHSDGRNKNNDEAGDDGDDDDDDDDEDEEEYGNISLTPTHLAGPTNYLRRYKYTVIAIACVQGQRYARQARVDSLA